MTEITAMCDSSLELLFVLTMWQDFASVFRRKPLSKLFFENFFLKQDEDNARGLVFDSLVTDHFLFL